MKIIIAAIMAAHLVGQASAGEWWFIGSTDDKPNRGAYFADSNTLAIDGQYRNIWVTVINETPEDRTAHARVLWRIDCVQHRSGITEFTSFAVDGSKLTGGKVSAIKWSSIEPETIAQSFERFACAGDRSKAQKVTDVFGFAKELFASAQ